MMNSVDLPAGAAPGSGCSATKNLQASVMDADQQFGHVVAADVATSSIRFQPDIPVFDFHRRT
ncbi:MAG: hypothetical protein ABIS34_10645, partial [Opitutus sp.]